jgi:hypothetical protein
VKGKEMSIQSQATPALSPSQRYLAVLLLRVRRIINRYVAGMLANREKAAMQFADGYRRRANASGETTVRVALHPKTACISSMSSNSRR